MEDKGQDTAGAPAVGGDGAAPAADTSVGSDTAAGSDTGGEGATE